VSFSSAAKWLLTVVLLLSIAWKITAFLRREPETQNNLISFLNRNHFVVTNQVVDGISIIEAVADSCHLQIADLHPDGSNQALTRRIFTDTDSFLVVFRGRLYAQQPIIWTMINNIWSRSLYELGLTDRVPPVIAVAANASCDAERLPWDELR
jgi:hypothetical protein